MQNHSRVSLFVLSVPRTAVCGVGSLMVVLHFGKYTAVPEANGMHSFGITMDKRHRYS